MHLAVTDADGALSGTLPATALFSAGQTDETVRLNTTDNTVQNDGARTVTFALTASTDEDYTLGDSSSVTVTVLDNDTRPSAPRTLTAQAGDSEVRLEWQAPLTDHGQRVTGYEYRRRTGTGSFSVWTNIPGSDAVRIGPDVTLYYRIRTAFRMNTPTLVSGMDLSRGFSATSPTIEVTTAGATGTWRFRRSGSPTVTAARGRTRPSSSTSGSPGCGRGHRECS